MKKVKKVRKVFKRMSSKQTEEKTDIMNDKIKIEVQKTLDSFEHAARLKADPWFYTRLKARMDAEPSRYSIRNSWQLLRKALKPAMILALVAANLGTAVHLLRSEPRSTTQKNDAIALFAQEFSLDSSQYNPILITNEQD